MLKVKSGVDGITGVNLLCILDVEVCGRRNRFFGCSGVPTFVVLPVFLINIGYFEFSCYGKIFMYFMFNFYSFFFFTFALLSMTVMFKCLFGNVICFSG